MAPKRIGYVISHTHWDRAWYWTFEQTRARLIYFMDDLLDLMLRDPRFKYFVLDGQAAMVEDYLEVRPERAAVIRELAAAGRLLLGPFFVLPDLFIPSGESLVRNLALGHQLLASRGPVMKIGYLPDPFGYPAQLPQILAGFGIDGLVFSRGMGERGEVLGADFYWEGPDGTRLLATHQVGGGYCNLARFGADSDGVPGALEQLERVLEQMAPYCPHQLFLLNNGCDHLPAQPELPDLIQAINRRTKSIRLKHSTPLAYQRAVRQSIKQGRIRPGIYRGELRGARFANLLSGVLSTRVDLKLLLHQCETALLSWAEPWSALASTLGVDREAVALINHAWRLLLSCQPHDNICGCSIDAVHEDDVNTMNRSLQIAEFISSRALQAIADQVRCPEKPTWVAFNPHPWTVRQVIFCAGVKPPRRGPSGQWPIQKTAGGSLIELELPPLGYRAFALESEVTIPLGDGVRVQRHARGVSLDNSEVGVHLDETGKVSIVHHETGLIFPKVAWLRDDGDAGDTYDYSPPAKQETVSETTGPYRLRIVEQGPLRATVELRYSLLLPVELSADRRIRSQRRRRVPLTLLLRLSRESSVVELILTVHNRVDDHRLRFCVELPFLGDEVLAGAPFQLVGRPIAFADHLDWHQRPSATKPFSDYIACETGAGGMAIFAPGLHEYEAHQGRKNTRLMVTLFRSVRWLSRGDLSTRRGHAGPAIPVQGARQLGSTTFRLALAPYGGNWQQAAIPRRALEHAAPCAILPSNGAQGLLDPAGSFFSLAPASVVLSSLSLAPSGTLVARIVNLACRPTRAWIKSPFQAIPIALDGRPLGKALDLENITMRPGEILTLRLS